MTDRQKNAVVYEKAVKNRIARATGHLSSVKKMVENERDCTEVLIQLAAVKSEISSTSRVILKQYLTECLEEALKEKDTQKIKEINQLMERFL